MAVSNTAVQQLLDAIDIIAEAKVKNNNSYNQTIICTITDNKNAKTSGYYTVTNDVITFDAYSENTTYKVGAYVRVTIPNGDYSQQKYIEGLYQYNNGEALTYVSPLDTFLDAATLIDHRPTDSLVSTSYGIVANGEPSFAAGSGQFITEKGTAVQVDKDISLSSEYYKKLQDDNIYNIIGIQADFKCLLGEYDVRAGNYGLRIDLGLDLNQDGATKVTHSIFLDSAHFIGNPYDMPIYSTQTQSFDISSIGTINSVSLSLYQDNNFILSDGSELPMDNEPNIFVSNIYLALGTDLRKVDDNTVKIYTTSDLSYRNIDDCDETNKKAIALQWYNKDEEHRYIGFSDGTLYDSSDKNDITNEIQFLKKQAAEKRLIGQQCADVYNTRNALDIAACLNEGKPHFTTMVSFIKGDLLKMLSSFKRRLVGCPAASLVDDWVTQITKLVDGDEKGQDSLSQQRDKFYDYVKYKINPNPGEAVTTFGYSDLEETITNIWKVSSTASIDGLEDQDKVLFDDVNMIFAPGIRKLVQNDYTSYAGIYDTFIRDINKFYELYIKYFENIENTLGKIVITDFTKEAVFIPTDTSKYDNKYDIYWYRYNPAYAEQDYFMTAGWEPIMIKDRFVKAGLPPAAAGKDGLLPKKCPDENNILEIYLDPNTVVEKIRAIVCYNHDVYYSNIIEFTNADELYEDISFVNNDNLVIEHGESSLENYQTYYASNYSLSSSAEASRIRELKLRCTDEVSGNYALSGAQLYWYIPNGVTMLDYDCRKEGEHYVGKLIDAGYKYMDANTKGEDGQGSKYYREGYVCFYKQLPEYTEDLKDEWDSYLSFYYKIKDYYIPTSLRNTITCLVVQDEVESQAEISFIFGTLGTCGTDYTLVLSPLSSHQTCVSTDYKYTDADNNNVTVSGDLKLVLGLYDYNGNEVSCDNITASLIDGSVHYSISREGNIVSIGYDGEEDDWKKRFGVLKVSTRAKIDGNGGDGNAETGTDYKSRLVDLSVLYPIPFGSRIYGPAAKNSSTYYIEGATTIIYDSFGTNPSYYKGPYRIYDNNHVELTNVTWYIACYDENHELITKANESYGLRQAYMPFMTKEATIVPSNMYLHDCPCFPVVYCCDNSGRILWAQSIYIGQNRYPSAMLNSWDGSLKVNENEGTIMSTMVGAGKKESDNSFSGVLMGDVELGKDGIDTGYNDILNEGRHSGLGLYGFHHGEQSFGFNVDGTAFMGKSGGGRIAFDGNHGFIYSQNWIKGNFGEGKGPFNIAEDRTTVTLNEGDAGMAIDLQNGHIDAYDFRLTSKGMDLNANPEDDQYYVDISTKREDGKNYYIRFDAKGRLIMNVADDSIILADQGLGGRTLVEFITSGDAALKEEIYTNIYPVQNGIKQEVETLKTDMGKVTEDQEEIWNQIDEDREANATALDNLKTYVNAQEYITQESVFNKLTNNGDNKGIWADKDDDGKIRELYINADYIVTGILRSQNWQGKLICTRGEGEDKESFTYNSIDEAAAAVTSGEVSWNDAWSIEATDGTFWNLNDGKLWAANFELNAWSSKDGGLYFNSKPNDDGSYFTVGEQNNSISFSKGKQLKIALTDDQSQFLLYTMNDSDNDGVNTGIYINSQPTIEIDEEGNLVNDYFIQIGNQTDFIQLSPQTGLEMATHHLKLDAWDSEKGGILLDSSPVNDTDYYFSIGKSTGTGMQFTKDGNLNIYLRGEKASFYLDALNGDKNGLYLNSDPDPNGFYISVGNATDYLQLGPDYGLNIGTRNLRLDAWNDEVGDDKPGYGIALWSNPGTKEHYFSVGDSGNFIQVTKDVGITIKANELTMDGWNKEKGCGVSLVSNPEAQKKEYYFKAGNEDYFIAFEKDGDLVLKIKDIEGLGIAINDPNNLSGSLNSYLTSLVTNITDAYQKADDQIQDALEAKIGEVNLTHDNVFNALTNNGTIEGIFRDNDNGNLYVNASYIATGVIKSKNVTIDDDGKIIISEGETGTYFDLDKGLLYSNDFDLIAENEDGSKLILTNTVTKADDYYFYIGKKNTGYVAVDRNFNVSVSGSIYATAGNIAGWQIDTALGFSRIYAKYSESSNNWYINLWKAYPETYIKDNKLGERNLSGNYTGRTQVSGWFSDNWRIQAGLTSDGGFTFPNGFGVTREGEIAASRGIIAGWQLGDDGLISSGGQMKILTSGIHCFAFTSSSDLNFISQNQYSIHGGIDNSSGTMTIKMDTDWWNYAYEILNNNAFDISIANVNRTEVEIYIVEQLPKIIENETLKYSFCRKASTKVTIKSNNAGKYLIINKSIAGDPLNSNTKSFSLTTKGGLAAIGANITGTINADEGKIGGWRITPGSLYSGIDDSYVAISATGDYAMWAGNSSAAAAPFSVMADGTIKAEKGMINKLSIGGNAKMTSLVSSSDSKTILSYTTTGGGATKVVSKTFAPSEITEDFTVELDNDRSWRNCSIISVDYENCFIGTGSDGGWMVNDQANTDWDIEFYGLEASSETTQCTITIAYSYTITNPTSYWQVLEDGSTYIGALSCTYLQNRFNIKPTADSEWTIGSSGVIKAEGSWTFNGNIICGGWTIDTNTRSLQLKAYNDTDKLYYTVIFNSSGISYKTSTIPNGFGITWAKTWSQLLIDL